MQAQSDVTELNRSKLTQFSFWRTDQWESTASTLDIGWRIHVRIVTGYWRSWDDAYCNALMFAHWPVRQKPNHVSSVQLSPVTSLCTRLKKRFNRWLEEYEQSSHNSLQVRYLKKRPLSQQIRFAVSLYIKVNAIRNGSWAPVLLSAFGVFQSWLWRRGQTFYISHAVSAIISREWTSIIQQTNKAQIPLRRLCDFHRNFPGTQIMAPTFVICVHDFPRREVSVKVGVMEFGLNQLPRR